MYIFVLDFIGFNPSQFYQTAFQLQRVQGPRPSHGVHLAAPAAAAARTSTCWMKAARHITFPAPSQEAPSPWSMSAHFASWQAEAAFARLGPSVHPLVWSAGATCGKHWALCCCLGLIWSSIGHHQQWASSVNLTTGFLLGHSQHWGRPSKERIKV